MSWLNSIPSPSFSLRLKRAFDVIAAGGGLVVLSPLLTTVLVLEVGFHGWPPFFVQERAGYRGRLFRILKFRTMTNERDAHGELLPDEERLTAFGQFLRTTSLDEFPELWNVLVGDMSLVGPRPLISEYLERYTPEQMRRHDMPPGITGWAQINGRNGLSWEEKFDLDVHYVDNWTWFLDLQILARTMTHLLKRDGIYAEGAKIMPRFTGTPARAPEAL